MLYFIQVYEAYTTNQIKILNFKKQPEWKR